MNSISTKAIVAVLATAIGLGAMAPAMAQTAPQASETAATTQGADGPADHAFRPQNDGARAGGGLGGFLDFDRGNEGIEVALVQISHRLDLTDAQKALLDTLKTSALAAAEDFATATEGLRPTPPAEGAEPVVPSVSERLENRIAMEKAQLAALEAVQPAATAFFDSLTDEQNAQLMPQRGEHDGGPRGQQGGHKQGPRGFGGNR
jgi:hypothetical protein